MSGHSKWHSIKHKKGAIDAKRGKVFSRINRAILAAARSGGADPDKNIELRNALLKAREANMPKDTIDRAIKKGTGELEGVVFENVTFEGYGPAGVALLIEVLTDNRNRTTADLRHSLTKNNGVLGVAGCVAWMFERKGVVYVPAAGLTEDRLMEITLDAGAEDLLLVGDKYEVKCAPESFEAVRAAVEKAGLTIESSELTMLPKSEVTVSESDARKILRLMEEIEELEDVQAVHSNFDIPDEVMAKLQAV